MSHVTLRSSSRHGTVGAVRCSLAPLCARESVLLLLSCFASFLKKAVMSDAEAVVETASICVEEGSSRRNSQAFCSSTGLLCLRINTCQVEAGRS